MTRCNDDSTIRPWHLVLAALTGAAILLPAAPADAWVFDDNACSPTSVKDVAIPPPGLNFMLDKSGSMDNETGYCCYDDHCGYWCDPSRWDVAVDVIDEVTLGMSDPNNPDKVQFGLGLFSSSIWGDADMYVSAGEDTRSDILNTLGNNGPGGGTPMGAAVRALKNSDLLQSIDQAGAGMLITDGYHNGDLDPIAEACDMRNYGPLYVVGFSSGTNTAYNNKLAAAGGTGCCGSTADATCSNGIGVDPCTNPGVDASTCHGSYQANNSQELKDALYEIVSEVQCTVPIDFTNSNTSTGPEDPDGVLVKVEGTNGLQSVPHKDSSSANPSGEGWYYATSSRDQVTLTTDYCDQIAAGEVTHVHTQLACRCQQTEGADCNVSGSDMCSTCSIGSWTCNEGIDKCHPYNASECQNTCVGHQPSSCVVPDAAGRCTAGIEVCNPDTGIRCEPIRSPMPELCNGLDDDCDGQVDNINDSWENSAFAAYKEELESDGNGHKACNFTNVCSCPAEWSDSPAGTKCPSTDSDDCAANYQCSANSQSYSSETYPEFTEFVDEHNMGRCECVPGLRE